MHRSRWQQGRIGRQASQPERCVGRTSDCTCFLRRLGNASAWTGPAPIERRGTVPSRFHSPSYTSMVRGKLTFKVRLPLLSSVEVILRLKPALALPVSWPSLARVARDTRRFCLLLFFCSFLLLCSIPLPTDLRGYRLLGTKLSPGEPALTVRPVGASTSQNDHTSGGVISTSLSTTDDLGSQAKHPYTRQTPREASQIISAELVLASLFEITPRGKRDGLSLESETAAVWPLMIGSSPAELPPDTGRISRTVTTLSTAPTSTAFAVTASASQHGGGSPQRPLAGRRRLQIQSSVTSMARFFLQPSSRRYVGRTPSGNTIFSTTDQQPPTNDWQADERHRVGREPPAGSHRQGSATGAAVPYLPSPRGVSERQYTLKELEERFNQLRPDERALLGRRVAEKALSHLEWFYTWQKKYAASLLLAEQNEEARRSSPSTSTHNTSLLGGEEAARKARRETPRLAAFQATGSDGEETNGWGFGWTSHIDSDVILPDDEDGNGEIHADRARGTPEGRTAAGTVGWVGANLAEEGVVEGQALWDQTAIALQRKNIPNITLTVDQLNEEVGIFLERYRDAVWSLPLQEIVNVTLNGGMFPELVERQNSSYPDLKRNVVCNPK